MVLDRRTLLRSVAAAVVGAITNPAVAWAEPLDRVGGYDPVPAPDGVLTRLPGGGNRLALTFDDGTDSEVVGAFGRFCRDSGVRLTFFPNGFLPSWTENAALLRPMVESGQILLGNHTWSHPIMTRLPASQAIEQIRRNADFLRNTYGVDGTPYFRPPSGARNSFTDRIAADLGYTTITMWSSQLGEDWLPGMTDDQLLGFADKAFKAQEIVLGHAAHPTITRNYDQLLEIINSRGLQTVTLADVFI